MGTAISTNRRLIIFIVIFLLYGAVHFLEANTIWGTWVFDKDFKTSISAATLVSLLDLYGGEPLKLLETGLVRLGWIKHESKKDKG